MINKTLAYNKTGGGQFRLASIKRKGFTLIELLAVIAIIGVLAAIIYPSITGIMKKSKADAYEIQIEEIEKAAGRWALKNASIMPEENGGKMTIYLRDLKKAGLLDKNLRNPVTKKKFPDDMMIIITKEGNKYSYVVDKESGTITEDIDMGVGSILLSGLPYEYVEINTSYTDKGAKGIDKNGSIVPGNSIVKTITRNGVTVSSVDTSILKEYEITYSATVDGKKLSVKRTVKIRDTTPPKLTIPLNTTLSSTAQSFDINGGVSAVDNSGERITVESKGNVTLGVPGNYILTYTAKDSSGNETVKKRTVTVVGDICTIVKVTGSTKTGISTQANVTVTAGTPNGSVPEDTTYQWQKLINGAWTSITGAESRTYTETTEIHMKYRVMYKQYGCTSYSNEYEVYIDRTPPGCPTYTGSKNPDTWSNTDIGVTITPSNDTENYDVAVSNSGGTYTSVGTKKGVFTQNYGSDGKWKTKAVVRDKANNSQTCYSGEYYIDKTAPSCSNSGGYGAWTSSNITLTGTCSDGLSGCTGNISRTYSWNMNSTTESPGTVYDNAGNSRVCDGNQRVHIDKIAPDCSSTGGYGAWTNGNITLTGTCSDGLSGCTGNISRGYTWEMNSTTESPGTVYDNAGNSRYCPANQRVHIDKTAPTCANSGGSEWTKNNVTITGNCGDNLSGCTGNVNPTYTSDINTTTASPGVVSDHAGNSTRCPYDRTVRIDKTPPRTPHMEWGAVANIEGYNLQTGLYGDCAGSRCGGSNLSVTLQSQGKICYETRSCDNNDTQLTSTRNCAYQKLYPCGYMNGVWKSVDNDGSGINRIVEETTVNKFCPIRYYGSTYHLVYARLFYAYDNVGNKSQPLYFWELMNDVYPDENLTNRFYYGNGTWNMKAGSSCPSKCFVEGCE